MPDPQPEIVAQVFEEADRLRRGDGRLEFLRTTEIIERHPSPPPTVVVDRGGRSGTYTAHLKATGSTGSTWYRATSMQARRVVETGTPTAAITDAPGSGRPKIDDPGSERFSVTPLR